MSDPIAAAPVPIDNAGVGEDFVDIFVSPAKVFARRAKASPMPAFLVVCIVMAVLFFASKNILAPVFDVQISRAMAAQMKSNPQLTQEMVDKMKPVMNVSISIGGVIGVPIILLVVSLVMWVIGRFFMGGELTYGAALLITSFSFFPRILSSLATLIQGLLMDVTKLTSVYQLTISAARLFDPATMTDGQYQLLAQADLFAIWGFALLVIGLIHAGKLEKPKAITLGVIMFLVSCLPAIYAVAKGN